MMVYSLMDWQFWFYLLWFGVAVLVSWYLPGSFFIRRLAQSPARHYLLSITLGAVLWTAQGYIFGYLDLRWLSYVYLAIMASLSLHSWREELHRCHLLTTSFQRVRWWVWGLIGLGGFNQYIHVAGTGLRYGEVVGFFRVNAADGMLHLSFISALVRNFPPIQPGAAGLPITNYHYWSDLMTAELARVWGLPIAHLFFQYVPLILVFGVGWATYVLIRAWRGNSATVAIGLFLLYFGGDLAYVFSLLLHRTWGFEVASIDNGATQLLNIPHATAKWVFLTALLPLTEWIKTRRWAWGILTVGLLGSVIGFKVYFGLFAGLGLVLVMGWLVLSDWHQALRHHSWIGSFNELLKKHWQTLLIGLVYLAISAAIFLPPNQHSGGLFWSPLEWPKLFLGADHLDYRDWWLRKQVYEAAGNTRNIIIMDVLAIAICLLSVYGTRLIGFWPWLPTYRKLGVPWLLFLIIPSLLFVFLGLYTLQVSGLFNVFNFFAVSAAALALLSAFTLGDWVKRNWFFKAAVILILLISLPRVMYHDWVAIQEQATLKFEKSYSLPERRALAFIRDQAPADAIVQSHPHNLIDHQTPYVAFFTNRQTYLSGDSMLQSHNQPITSHQANLKSIFASSTERELAQQLRQLKIDYLFLRQVPEEQLPFPITGQDLEIVFENSGAQVIAVKPNVAN